MVLFYSNGLLVRKYTLNEFKIIDITKVVGYASAKAFEGWEFIDAYSSYSDESPLTLIKTYFTSMSNLPDITLNAKYSEVTEIEDVPLYSKTIAHALGGLNRRSYLNSKEAFEFNYNKGFRFFEADIALTTDNIIVLDHDRGEFTYESFMNMASDGYTPLSLQNLFDYMTVYPEIWIDLDTVGFKNNQADTFVSVFKQLILSYDSELLDRIIVEITPWNETLIDLLKNEIGIKNFLYTEGLHTNDLIKFEDICKFCFDNKLDYVGLADNRYEITQEKIDLCKKYGLYVLVYTVNSAISMYDLYDFGVDCIFTDFTMI